MKKITKRLKPLIFAALILLFVAILGAFVSTAGGVAASASTHGADYLYTFHFTDYVALYDIESNRKATVTETLTVKYTGAESTGFYKTIPVNGGELVKNIHVYESINGAAAYVWHRVETLSGDDGTNFVAVNVGDGSVKAGETHTYVISYEYCLTKAQEGENVLSLNVIGCDRLKECDVKNAKITLLLPDGYIDGKCFVGTALGEYESPYKTSQVNGKTAVTIEGLSLKYNEGVTFDLNFEGGSLTTYSEFTPYWFIIAGAALLLVLVAVKFLFFNNRRLVPVVNFEAPENMDPLLMGKLIDNRVNKEDITALIFYFADKGYLKINLDNKDDPLLIRLVRSLPPNSPQYQKLMFAELFKGGDAVRPSMLSQKFYSTVEKMTAMVNSQTKGLYSSKSMGISIIFALLGGLLTGLAPLILALTQVSSTYFVVLPFIALLPALVIYALSETVMYHSVKFDFKKKLLLCFGIALGCVAFSFLYALLAPGWLMSFWSKALLGAVSCLIITLAVTLVCRTESYTQKLNQIVGFKRFIQLVEKDRLEKLLEENPQFYYHVLPYAQVLGVSEIWEQKFSGLTVAPPVWATSSGGMSWFEFHLFNRMFRHSLVIMSANMVSRPSSAGKSGFGGFGGGHMGGHVGGGHGGGGFRGR